MFWQNKRTTLRIIPWPMCTICWVSQYEYSSTNYRVCQNLQIMQQLKHKLICKHKISHLDNIQWLNISYILSIVIVIKMTCTILSNFNEIYWWSIKIKVKTVICVCVRGSTNKSDMYAFIPKTQKEANITISLIWSVCYLHVFETWQKLLWVWFALQLLRFYAK